MRLGGVGETSLTMFVSCNFFVLSSERLETVFLPRILIINFPVSLDSGR